VQAIVGQRFIAPFLDRLLARTAYEGQFSDEPLPAGREDNLHSPIPGDAGMHGRFSAQARALSPQHWANTHRGALAAAGLLALAGVLSWRRRSS
jgi:MYXO-CTERM domain-containing protein